MGFGDFEFRVSGFRFQVLGFRFRVFDFGFGFRVVGFKFRASGLGVGGSAHLIMEEPVERRPVRLQGEERERARESERDGESVRER